MAVLELLNPGVQVRIGKYGCRIKDPLLPLQPWDFVLTEDMQDYLTFFDCDKANTPPIEFDLEIPEPYLRRKTCLSPPA